MPEVVRLSFRFRTSESDLVDLGPGLYPSVVAKLNEHTSSDFLPLPSTVAIVNP